MKLIAISAVAVVVALSGCATQIPTTLTLKDPHHRHINDEVAATDEATARRCVENMLNASPAVSATDISTKVIGTGRNVIVDVDATLLDVGFFGRSLPVSFRCTGVNGMMSTTWTGGLKGG